MAASLLPSSIRRGVAAGALVAGLTATAPAAEMFRYEPGPALPVELNQAAAGKAFGELVVAGGWTGIPGEETHNSTIYVLRGEQWASAGIWEDAPVHAAVAETDRGLVCVAGWVDHTSSRSVTLLDPRDGSVRRTPLPELPPIRRDGPQGVSAVGIGNKVYVIEVSGSFFVLDLASPEEGWETLPRFPNSYDYSWPAMAALQGKIYLFGGDSLHFGSPRIAYRYEPGRGWAVLHDAPEALHTAYAVACGAAHILVFNSGSDSLLAYHTITDAWVELATLAEPMHPFGVTGDGTTFTLLDGNQVLTGEAVLTPTKYGWLDHGVVGVYLIGMLLVGAFLARREKGSQDYFRGGQRIPWWASGLSLFATGASAISLMAMPGKSFAEDWAYFSISIYSALMLPLVILVFVPIARRLKVATSNEYLERRFNLPTRLFGGVIFSVNQMLARMATIMLLPSIALSAIVGMPMETSILIMGVVTTVYVTLGGLEAVVWTDVIQALVMLLSVLVCILWAVGALHADAPTAMKILADQHKLAMFDFGVSLVRPTVFLMFANIFVTTLGGIGDQNFIQRVQCTPSEKDARKAVITQMSVAVPLNFVLFTLGTVLFLFYRERPELLNPALKTDGIYPLFAAQMLPPGVAGLVVASLLAATMSTLSSAVNSVANVGVEDFYRRLSSKKSDHTVLVLGRGLSIGLGIFGTCAALLLARTSLTSIWDLAVLVTGIVAAPIAGIFTLGIFTRRANSAGVLIGSTAAIAVAVFARYGMTVHPFFNLVAGVAACIVVGYAASLIIPSTPRDLKGLTVYTLDAAEAE